MRQNYYSPVFTYIFLIIFFLYKFKLISMATFVEGEATETDSEDEQYFFNLSNMKVLQVLHSKN